MLQYRFLGAAGVQYGRYMEKVLHSSSLPRRQGTALTLTRVAMRVWDTALAVAPPLKGVQGDQRSLLSTSRCVMAVYQRGKQIWSQAASALVNSAMPYKGYQLLFMCAREKMLFVTW